MINNKAYGLINYKDHGCILQASSLRRLRKICEKIGVGFPSGNIL
jgi:hypothetical protein